MYIFQTFVYYNNLHIVSYKMHPIHTYQYIHTYIYNTYKYLPISSLCIPNKLHQNYGLPVALASFIASRRS